MNIHSSSCSFYEHDKMSFYTMPTGHGVEVDDTPFRRRCHSSCMACSCANLPALQCGSTWYK